jgi:hypothetical protein
MLSIVRGKTITLSARYVDASGAAHDPISPMVDIINPLGVTVVNNDTPTAAGPVGFYEYDFTVPNDALLGEWGVVWTGTIDGQPAEANGTFTVLAGGGHIIISPCPDNPLWASPEDFALANSTSLEEAVDAIAEATWLVWSLTGRRYHGIECREDEYQHRRGICLIELEHDPVLSVTNAVKVINGEEQELRWSASPGGRVRICCGGSGSTGRGAFGVGFGQGICTASCDDSVIRVRYKIDSNLPPGAVRVVNRLAREFWKSASGTACALPERITNVSKQGVSWTILDPLDFLDKGLTGIGAVDSWISALNGRGNARLIDPLTRSRLFTSTVTGCGEACA